MIPGFSMRLQQELAGATYLGAPFEVISTPTPKYSAWIGGSLVSSLSTFRHMCIPSEEYNEYGPVLLLRKCFGVGA